MAAGQFSIWSDVQTLGAAGDWWPANWLAVSILGLVLIVILVAGGITYRKLCPPEPKALASPNDGETRSSLARNVIIFAITGVVLLALAVLITSGWKPDVAQFVFGAVLPLLGTWVGTVLAYYFARENLAAATQSVSSFAEHLVPGARDDEVSVQNRMRKLNDIRRVTVDAANDGVFKLTDLVRDGVERIVIVDKNDVLRYLIYKSVLDAYRLRFTGSNPTPLPTGRATVDDLVLKDLVGDDKDRLFERSWATVDPRATIGDARRAMARQGEKCNDVFVTATGARTAPIIGWITDNKLAAGPTRN